MVEWLGTTTEDDLDTPVDVESHVKPFPIYATRELRDTAPWLYAGPAMWRVLGGTCIGHYRDHLTETDLLKQHARRAV